MKTLILKNLIKSLSFTAFILVVSVGVVNAADCDPTYGGGEICLVNKRFEIEKEVRICEDEDVDDADDCDDWGDWEDKVVDVQNGQIIQFRIVIKNLSDKEAGEFNNMKMEDFLPSEIERVGGSGLTEYWDDFEPNEKKEFKIEVLIDPEEFDRENFEKCIVNKAEVEWDDNFEGSDTATVCYGDVEVKELPKTGSGSIALLGLIISASGVLIRKKLA